ncbi:MULTISPECIES: TfoX/Sxy family protein [Xanthomonas]|uniref:TfoX/Sxy family protein n=1 Tax=Xanthomonas TaxID=338 RepID=UPI0004DF3922|nr:TfoX/Sxy family protein [Xanthomonas euvesicatoria]MBO9793836.1 TfoX/Sxy family protein [Xanthomonas phaseoli pv. dieffenbachiae]MBO9858447.1 TfoX/Sxy family protein [Xanthomonas sp. A1809]MBV6777304.1 TfoX/Sxy family protein [Xanthomonas campestris pv. carissae]MBV6784231.1 TfoX/Sxy family protein [Xanthomonas campestris pv. uppalii]MBV6787902.1 TfoX/Sxy family protein [Xanthomonas campestris pv. clerodendri]MBV6800966.1 TfoX/Sxy family protein [Xanthomonas campestris pv. lawsoniae]MBV68
MTTERMRNIGPKSAAWLRQVGLRTQQDLQAVGAVGAFVKVRRAGFKPSLNLLYSLEGALADCHWQDVPEARRHALLAEYEAASALLPVRGRAVGGPVETVHYARADNDDTHGDAATATDLYDAADAERAGED